jgi:hypothetical protein
MLTLADIAFDDAAALLARYGLGLQRVADGDAIPGSYWGEREAGIIGSTVYARADTPLHSLLHEAGHLIVLPPERRAGVHTDATDSIEEEDAVCVLQALLADALPGVGRGRVLADMDAWGYTFRLGCAAAYVERDADEAWAWLQARGLVDGERALLLPGAGRRAESQGAGRNHGDPWAPQASATDASGKARALAAAAGRGSLAVPAH